MTRQQMRRRPARAHSAAIAESRRASLDLEQVAERAAEIVLARLSAGLAAEPAALRKLRRFKERSGRASSERGC